MKTITTKHESSVNVCTGHRADFRPYTKSCTAWDLIITHDGLQCTNCGAMYKDKNGYATAKNKAF